MSHDVDFMVNYTWCAEIDDNGTFRNGYLPTRVERSRGLSDFPNVFNATGIFKLPFGTGQPFNPGNRILRTLVSDFQLSAIYTYASGTPLAIVASGCVTPGGGQCMPDYNPNYVGSPRIGSSWGKGMTAATASTTHFIDINAFIDPSVGASSNSATRAMYPQYTIGNLARTRPYGLRGPANFDGDISLKRKIVLHDRYNLLFDASAFNITNSFIPSSPAVSTSTPSTFGTVTSQANSSRDIQLALRLNF